MEENDNSYEEEKLEIHEKNSVMFCYEFNTISNVKTAYFSTIPNYNFVIFPIINPIQHQTKFIKTHDKFPITYSGILFIFSYYY